MYCLDENEAWIPARCWGCRRRRGELADRAQLKRCKSCGTAVYCSTRCQERHWTRHRAVCPAMLHLRDFVWAALCGAPGIRIEYTHGPLLDFKRFRSCQYVEMGFDKLDGALEMLVHSPQLPASRELGRRIMYRIDGPLPPPYADALNTEMGLSPRTGIVSVPELHSAGNAIRSAPLHAGGRLIPRRPRGNGAGPRSRAGVPPRLLPMASRAGPRSARAPGSSPRRREGRDHGLQEERLSVGPHGRGPRPTVPSRRRVAPHPAACSRSPPPGCRSAWPERNLAASGGPPGGDRAAAARRARFRTPGPIPRAPKRRAGHLPLLREPRRIPLSGSLGRGKGGGDRREHGDGRVPHADQRGLEVRGVRQEGRAWVPGKGGTQMPRMRGGEPEGALRIDVGEAVVVR
ncbi:hypothetical protein DFJ74DRAFT_660171 [Hyaloraphidium curvatum]|nr:hypothetical protein DFJ74DRAFT_660171 [Hyaloraphidium curvatum]